MRLGGRALASLSFVATWLAFASGARAQVVAPETAPYAPPSSPAAVPPEAPAPPAPVAPRADPHDEVLRRLLSSGCRDGLPDAQALAASGGATWAETVTRLCGEILSEERAAYARAHDPRSERDGRGVLVIYSTLYGTWAGIAFDVLFTVDGVRSAVVAPLVGMGAGLALSLALTANHPITSGQAWSIVTGYDYGSINGALWAGAFDFGSQDVVGTALATGVAASAAGLLVATQVVPRQGEIEVVRSGLLWGTVAGLLGMATFAPDSSEKSIFRAAAVSMDLGLLAGIALASSFEVSRTRDLIIDAGTLGGGVAGLGIAVIALGTNGSSGRAGAGGGLAGMMAGMLATIYLTRDMDRSDDDQGPPVAALLGRDGRGRWRLGTPGATPVFDGLGRRVVGATFTALGGTF